jgi:glycosyltransferase involved in cell wall biosynthesis
MDGLTRAGWEVSIATTVKSDHAWLERFARKTPDIFLLENFLRLVDYPRFLRYLIRSRGIDVVLITQSELGYLLLPYLRAHCPDTAFVDYCHIEESYWKNGGYPRLSVEYQELLETNIVTSHHLRSWMVERGAAPERIAVSTANVDTATWHPDPARRARVRSKLGLDDVPVIIYPARICAQKQPHVFARVVARLAARGERFVALVAGDGPQMQMLRDTVTKMKLQQHVRLLGAVSPERLKDLYVASDILFLPSQWEGIALSLYESMASGLAIVGAAVGGQRELVTPDCGLLVERGTEDQEVDAYVVALAALLRDPARVVTMGRAGRARVEHGFRIDQMHGRMIALLEDAIRRHRSEPRPTPGIGLARACAAHAVEYVRLFHLSEWLWSQRSTTDTRVRTYRMLTRFLEPLYHRGVERGWKWLPALRSRVKLVLLGRA